MIAGAVLNPTSDGFPAQLDIHSESAGYRILVPADFPPPAPKPAYASSYDTEGSVATDPAHYENRQIGLNVRVSGTSAANLEARLNALYKVVGQINREGGVLKITTPAGTVCYFDLVPEAAAAATIDKLYVAQNVSVVACQFQARPFWRGAEVDLGTVSETTLPALVATYPQSAPFDSPDDLAGLAAWYKPETLGAGTSAIAQWDDSSGNARHLLQGTGGSQPVVAASVLDGFKAARFDGSNDFLRATFTLNQPFTLFVVAKWRSAFTAAEQLIGGVTGDVELYRSASATMSLYAGATACTLTTTPESFHAYSGLYNTASSELRAEGGTAATGNISTTNPGGITVGASTGGAQNADVDVVEIVVYSSALSASDRAKVEGYLSAKYPTLGAFGTAPSSTSIKGDVPALGRLVITDTESGGKDRWTVIVGGESRYYNSSTASTTSALFIQAESLTPKGTSATAVGATGASGAGSNVMRNTDLTTTYQTVLQSNQTLSHKGTFRVWARLYRPAGNTGAVSARIEWSQGDYTHMTQNDPVAYGADDREGMFTWANLGLVTLDPRQTRWGFRFQAKSTVAGDELDADCFLLVPTEVTYIELSGKFQAQSSSSFIARDEFDQTAGALAAKVAPVGGTWQGGGSANDFAVETAGHTAQRTAVSDADLHTGRYVVLSGSTPGTVAVQVDFKLAAFGGGKRVGVVARYTDSNNWLIGAIADDSGTTTLLLQIRVAGTLATLRAVPVGDPVGGAWYTIQLQAYGDRCAGFFGQQGQRLQLVATGSHPQLSSALATGKVGFYDARTFATAMTRNFDNFTAFAPFPDAALFATRKTYLYHDRAERDTDTGTVSDITISNRSGRYLKIPPAGPEGRSTRLAVLALPNDPYTMGDPAAIYDLSSQLYVTPRGLVVPEA